MRTSQDDADELALVDVADADYWQDSHSVLRAARERGPVARSSTGELILLRYGDIEAVTGDRRVISNALAFVERQVDHGPLVDWWRLMLTNLNGPEHVRLRSLVYKAFTPRSVDAKRPRIRELTREILSRHRDAGELDGKHPVEHSVDQVNRQPAQSLGFRKFQQQGMETRRDRRQVSECRGRAQSADIGKRSTIGHTSQQYARSVHRPGVADVVNDRIEVGAVLIGTHERPGGVDRCWRGKYHPTRTRIPQPAPEKTPAVTTTAVEGDDKRQRDIGFIVFRHVQRKAAAIRSGISRVHDADLFARGILRTDLVEELRIAAVGFGQIKPADRRQHERHGIQGCHSPGVEQHGAVSTQRRLGLRRTVGQTIERLQQFARRLLDMATKFIEMFRPRYRLDNFKTFSHR